MYFIVLLVYFLSGVSGQCPTGCYEYAYTLRCNPLNESICTTCKNWWWGSSCDKPCPSTCYEYAYAERCRRDSGDCVACPYWRYGDECEHSCDDGCYDYGYSNRCGLNDGACVQCKRWRWGLGNTPLSPNSTVLTCKNSCSDGCYDYRYVQRCDRVNGKCTSCVKHRWGEFCENWCSSACYDYGYVARCDRDTGACYACDRGKWGSHCENTCPGTCSAPSGAALCHQETGECTNCAKNKWGPTCEFDCVDCYGSNDAQWCEKHTGRCLHCGNSRMYGTNCTIPCPDGCYALNEGRNCDRESGACTACNQDRWGEFCENTCAVDCYGSSDNSHCDRETGVCFNCAKERWGTYCEHQCAEGCYTSTDTRHCDRWTGQCTMCKPDRWKMPLCTEQCASSAYTAEKVRHCDVETGFSVACRSNDVWGPDCDRSCPTGCSSAGCHRDTSQCHVCSATSTCPCGAPHAYLNAQSNECELCAQFNNTYSVTGLESVCFCAEGWPYGAETCVCEETLIDTGTMCAPCKAHMKRVDGISCDCEQGYYATFTTFDYDTSECVPCVPGFFCAGGMEPPGPCPAGWFGRLNSETGLSECVECELGFISVVEEATECTPCAAGWEGIDADRTQCRSCVAGSYGRVASNGAGECLFCPLGSISVADNALECTACGAGMQGVDGDRTRCVACTENSFKVLDDGSQCLDCPQNARCEGGSATPKALRGYWDDPDDADFSMFECENVDICLGDNQCGGNRDPDSFVCSRCAIGFYSLLEVCRPCPTYAGLRFAAAIIGGLLVILVASFVFDRIPGGGAVAAGVINLQVLGLFVGFRIDYPKILEDILGYLLFFTVDVDVAAPECAFPGLTISTKWFVIMGSGAVLLTVLFLWSGTASSSIEWKKSARRAARVRRAGWQMFVWLFLMMSLKTMQAFDCVWQPDGRVTLRVDAGQPCLEGVHTGMFVLAIYMSLLLAGVVIYLWTRVKTGYKPVKLLMKRAERDDLPLTAIEFGFLWRDFHVDSEEMETEAPLRCGDRFRRSVSKYFFLVSLLRRFLLVIVAAFVGVGGTQLWVAFAFSLLFLIAFTVILPYQSAAVNVADFVGALCALVFLIVSKVLDDDTVSGSSETTWTVVGLGTALASALSALFAFAFTAYRQFSAWRYARAERADDRAMVERTKLGGSARFDTLPTDDNANHEADHKE